MEVYLYNSSVCRLCGEENDNGTLLYSSEENNQSLSEVINTYLPLKVLDDGQLPRTICPGCTIQLEATVEFLNLIINGQKVLRELYQREKEYKKSLQNVNNEQDVITEKIVYEVNTSNGVYQVEHPIALQVAGLDKPKRKRGRPPKKKKTPEEQALEIVIREKQINSNKDDGDNELSGKRRRKMPTRFSEVVQGKELDRIFIAEGLIDRDEIEKEAKVNAEPNPVPKPVVPKEPEVIGHLADSGEVVMMDKSKGRGRPKGRMRVLREECAICGMEFSCAGRYMSHIANHGPVIYQCGECSETFTTKLTFNNHQKEESHKGLNVIPCADGSDQIVESEEADTSQPPAETVPPPELDTKEKIILNQDLLKTPTQDPSSIPEITLKVDKGLTNAGELKVKEETLTITLEADVKIEETSTANIEVKKIVVPVEGPQDPLLTPPKKPRVKCNHCDKTFSCKQSKSMHIKATHRGERPYTCNICGARFPYPRSLVAHTAAHRRGYACDLCGKVLSHPSSVVYHKAAEHSNQQFVCNKCGKSFKHKQLLQRHQLVHTAHRPYCCKMCDASFKTNANLLNHQLLHSGVKKYACELCNQKFAHKTSLTLHMRWHSGQKPFSCKTCGKSFSQRGNLSEHERIHSGEKPFQCHICQRKFTTSSQHRLHINRHKAAGTQAGATKASTRRVPPRQTCGECGRSFAERWALQKHMRCHSGERPFACSHCPRTFSDHSNLNKHKKQVHKQISLLASSQPQVTQEQQVVQQQLVPQQVVQQKIVQQQSIPQLVVQQKAIQQLVPQQMVQQQVVPQQMIQQQIVQQKIVQQQMVQQQLVPQGLVQENSPSKLTVVMDEDTVERVIYVTYDVDNAESPTFHLMEPDQVEEVESGVTIEEPEPVEQHVPVTDEQGNPLHFTMQDGTRLAITSTDGKSLQVITRDGQTIPVEINGYNDEDVENEDTIVHQLNLQSLQTSKSVNEIPESNGKKGEDKLALAILGKLEYHVLIKEEIMYSHVKPGHVIGVQVLTNFRPGTLGYKFVLGDILI